MRCFPCFRTGFLLAIALAGMLGLSACGESEEARSARLIRERQEQLAKDQQERAALIAQTKAAMAIRNKKQGEIDGVQVQIDAIEEQISYNRQRGKDCRTLEKTEEDLEARKYELERQ